MDGGTQLSLFYEENKQAVSASAETITVTEHQQKKKRTHDAWMSSLEIQEERHEEEHPMCEKCGAEMEEIGEEKMYNELVFVSGKIFVRRHIVKKYNARNAVRILRMMYNILMKLNLAIYAQCSISEAKDFSQLLLAGIDGTYCLWEIRQGSSAVSTGEGLCVQGYPVAQSDHVRLGMYCSGTVVHSNRGDNDEAADFRIGYTR